MQNFEPKMVDLPLIFFLKKIINIIFIYILTPLIVKILKADPELSACAMHAGMQACRHAVFAKFYNEPKELLFYTNS